MSCPVSSWDCPCPGGAPLPGGQHCVSCFFFALPGPGGIANAPVSPPLCAARHPLASQRPVLGRGFLHPLRSCGLPLGTLMSLLMLLQHCQPVLRSCGGEGDIGRDWDRLIALRCSNQPHRLPSPARDTSYLSAGAVSQTLSVSADLPSPERGQAGP